MINVKCKIVIITMKTHLEIFEHFVFNFLLAKKQREKNCMTKKPPINKMKDNLFFQN